MADQIPNSTATNNISARLDCANWLSFAITTLLALTIYLCTLTPEIELAWSGILTTGAMYGGVGPPPGYPAWTIYSWLFIHLLPFYNPAWRVAVGSAVAGAVSCGLVALMVSRSGKLIIGDCSTFKKLSPFEKNLIRGFSGYVAGMALGFSGSLWNEALIPDFGIFTLLLFVGILHLLLRWMETGRRHHCWLAFLLFGLLLTNSQEMIVALPAIACAMLLINHRLGRDVSLAILPIAAAIASLTQFGIWDRFSSLWDWPVDWPLFIAFFVPFTIAIGLAIGTRQLGSEWKTAVACLFCLMLGFATYLYLPIVSTTNPPVNWGYTKTLEGFLILVGRYQYEHVIPTGNLRAFNIELWTLIKQTGGQFGWLYVPFAIIPFCFFLRMTVAGRKWIAALLLISICVGPLLSGMLNFSNDRQSQELAEYYFFPLRVPLALFTGIGLTLLGMKMATLGRAREESS